MIKLLFKGLGTLLLLLLVTMIFRAWSVKSVQIKSKEKALISTDTLALAHLAEAIRFKTISFEDSPNGSYKLSELKKLHDFMQKTYPLVFKTAEIQVFGQSKLITWKGSDTGLKPALFLAHLDVVPATEIVNGAWSHPPFSGFYTNDTLYGRGTLDDKGTAIAMLEALERHLSKGFKPRRTLMIALGQDEETGGHRGAAIISKYLQKQGIKAEFICDEGFGVLEGMVPGFKRPVALIGTSEKGFLSLKLSVEKEGGHSSMPDKENATSVLTKALSLVDNAKYFEALPAPQKAFFQHLAPEASLFYRFLFANVWITEPLLKFVLRGSEKSAATIQTTHAITVLSAGNSTNVLPAKAEAIVNFRILPGNSIEQIHSQIKELLKDLPVKIEMLSDRNNPSPVSADKGEAWELICSTISEVFDSVYTAPALAITGSDCKNYIDISDQIYRFVPFRFNNNNLSGIHGNNEKLAAKNFYEAITYYERLFGKI
jgi:carboxypeptidase PM20D1